MQKRTAIIIGAGPAGLTAAYEILEKTDITPIVFEADGMVGGISRTVNFGGNRLDIGGHRFFSKSDKVVDWWLGFLPLEGTAPPNGSPPPDPESTDRVMLLRSRLSRILFGGQFIGYPIALNASTLSTLGPMRIIRILGGYVRARLFPIKHVRSMEDFFINRFGRELYETFFRDYTEKVFGMPCSEIMPEWGAQRVKSLSVWKTLVHALKSAFGRSVKSPRTGVESTLIDRFMYPKYGPGQLWELVADSVAEKGGEIHLNHKVTGIKLDGTMIDEVTVRDETTGESRAVKGDYFFSTMPVSSLVGAMDSGVPDKVRRVAQGLGFRDFMVVGILLKKMKLTGPSQKLIPDNWIYIQDKTVKIGRLQIFNNWSPYMVADPEKVWLGAEYFANEGDELWTMPDEGLVSFAAGELSTLGFIDESDVIEGVVVRMPKAYPVYSGAFGEFDVVREFTDKIENLFLIGRNGMHRYNNMDHSMLTAMQAVDMIVKGSKDKSSIWAVNADEDYHEEK